MVQKKKAATARRSRFALQANVDRIARLEAENCRLREQIATLAVSLTLVMAQTIRDATGET